MKCLNLGCGNRFVESDEWVNIDFISNSRYVVEHDLSKGIPFQSEEFDFIYHSHILEHFSKEKGEEFIEECYRVLKKNGLIRIAIPDLEMLAKQYLENMERVLLEKNQMNDANYAWSVIELIDQMVKRSMR